MASIPPESPNLSSCLTPRREQRITQIVHRHARSTVEPLAQTFPLQDAMMKRRLMVLSNQALSGAFAEVSPQLLEVVSVPHLMRTFLPHVEQVVENGFINKQRFIEAMGFVAICAIDYLLTSEPEKYGPIVTPHDHMLKSVFEF